MRFYILFAHCFDISLLNYLMAKNVGVHLILVFCLLSYEHSIFRMFDFSDMLFLLESELTFLLTGL